MAATASHPIQTPESWLTRLSRRFWAIFRIFCRVVLVGWATLAIFYTTLPWFWARLALALAFLAFSIWALWGRPKPRMRWVFAGLFLAVLVWFISLRPSHDRLWRPEVAVMPRAVIDGDRVRFTGVRNFDYRSTHDFTVRYEEREVLLSHLNSLDFYLSLWMPGPVGHTFVSFGFDNAPPIAISIETRPETGEGFNPIASLFKQFELIYVVGEERDIVRVRTDHRDEQVYLYRIKASPEGMRLLFLTYIDRINELADHAEFYHLLKNSCTVNIVSYANAAGRQDVFDIRHLLNGLIDRYLYRAGWIDTSMPFAELHRRSHINEAARAAGDSPDFSERIRASLPGMASPEPSPLVREGGS